MTYKELQNKIIEATKERNKLRKAVYSDISNYVINSAIEKKCKDNITEDIVNNSILKAKKVCQEQIDTCPSNRTDRLEEYNTRMMYINEIAPKMMSEDEIRKIIYDLLLEIEIKDINKGTLMKAAMPKLKDKADGRTVNKIVTEILNKEKNNE